MKKLIIIVLFAVALCFVTSCSNKESSAVMYALSGENEAFTVSNGKIIITDEAEEFIGGDIAFKHKTLSGVKEYNTRFYYYEDGEEIAISSNSVSIVGSDVGMDIEADLGTSSSTGVFLGNHLRLVQESLHFRLTGTFLSGEAFVYEAPIDVVKIN